jgi:hypothetical protein
MWGLQRQARQAALFVGPWLTGFLAKYITTVASMHLLLWSLLISVSGSVRSKATWRLTFCCLSA